MHCTNETKWNDEYVCRVPCPWHASMPCFSTMHVCLCSWVSRMKACTRAVYNIGYQCWIICLYVRIFRAAYSIHLYTYAAIHSLSVATSRTSVDLPVFRLTHLHRRVSLSLFLSLLLIKKPEWTMHTASRDERHIPFAFTQTSGLGAACIAYHSTLCVCAFVCVQRNFVPVVYHKWVYLSR